MMLGQVTCQLVQKKASVIVVIILMMMMMMMVIVVIIRTGERVGVLTPNALTEVRHMTLAIHHLTFVIYLREVRPFI